MTGRSNVEDAVAGATGAGNPEQLRLLKDRQKVLRTKITSTIRQVETMVRERDSRRGVKSMLARAQTELTEAEQLDDSIMALLAGPAAERQHSKHLGYARLVDSWDGAVERYLEDRRDDPASVVTRASRPASVGSRRSAQRQEEIVAAQQRNDAARELAVEALRREQEARREADAAEQALRALELHSERSSSDDEDLAELAPSRVHDKAVRRWLALPGHSSAPDPVREEDEAPDDWIERYLTGRERSLERASCHQHHHAVPMPEAFSGRALDWFAWAEQFYTAVHHTRRSTAEKLALLKKSLKGTAATMVIGAGEPAYREGLRRLKKEYGKRTVMRAAHLQELGAIELSKSDPAAFKRAALSVRTHLFELSQLGDNNNADVIERICHKMSLNDRLAWNEGCGGGLERRTLTQFGEWLCNRADAYQNVFGIVADQTDGSASRFVTSGGRPVFRGRSHQHARANQAGTRTGPRGSSGTTPAARPFVPFCFKCEAAHRIEECMDFKKLSAPDRTAFTIRHSLCFQCLRAKHDVTTCWRKRPCGESGCTANHHPLLHTTVPTTSHTSHSASARPSGGRSASVALGVVRLDAIGANGLRVPVNVMLDEGSTGTLVREGLVRRLGIRGTAQTLSVDGVGGSESRFAQSRWVEFELLSASGEAFAVQGSTMPVVAKSVPVTDWPTMQSRWAHLSDLPVQSSGGRVDVLLGLNHAYLMAVQESREAGAHDPVASRTRLGWVVRGVVGGDLNVRAVRVNHALTTIAECEFGPELTEALHRLCDTEAFGTEHQEDCVSPDNKRAARILEEGLLKLETGYQAPILWREGEPQLPDNRQLAENRIRSLSNRFSRDPAYEKRYRASMQKSFDEGYAVRLTAAEQAANSSAYYLAHFGVEKNTPERDVRIVFDAAAKYRGRCLNDSIHSGPALQNPLPAVITRFREGEVAWASDIKAMFSRIRLRPEDMRYHRFLWPEEDGTTSVCQMTRLTFGVNCAPYVAIRTTWRAAEDAGADREEAERAIKGNVYVDDYLDSARTQEEGIRTATLVKRVLAGGDFHLQEFVSNSPELSTALQPAPVVVGADPDSRSLITDDAEMVLGITWRPRKDMLGFRVSGHETVTYTRVGLVSKVAGLFDPLGTAAPMTVKGKIRLRALVKQGLHWADPVVEDRAWWQRWFQVLAQLSNVEVPRCLFPMEDDIDRIELHGFADASEEAYAAVCYLRMTYRDGNVLVRHVTARTKLAPTKTLSTNKLELNAALLTARLATWVERALRRKIEARYFWTDSSTVRHWVRATAAYYQVFVSHRVGEIQTLTKPPEWRFCPGKLNPADAATRSVLEDVALPEEWLLGPKFLYGSTDRWPADIPFVAVTDELRSVRSHHAVDVPTFDWANVQLTAEHVPALVNLDEPYRELVRRCQQEVYHADLERLKKGKALKATSDLLALTPVIGPDGLLRLGGRIGKAQLPYDRLHPPLLPGRHPLARKIIEAFHVKLQHGGVDHILTQVRHHFWITHGREAVKKVRRACAQCLRLQARPAVQRMGDLPLCRVDAGTTAFTHTACDYFGPMETSPGRNRVTKRWGALFTCLVTRAVYLDLANSLSSNDFLLVLRRFMALHGKPKHLHSDNGTNFVGAERELREAVDELHADEDTTAFLRKEAVQWHFQPARTPHFGGAHESLVRLTKRALYAALDQEKLALRYPTDEVLRTLLSEVAGHLNSRPLWYASPDPQDVRPLTPNDLLGRPPTADQPGDDVANAPPRDHYRYLQRALNLFWDHWKGPYLQSLAARKKWKGVHRNLAVGDLVMESDPSLKRGDWNVGRVVKVHPGTDGLVRAVDVQFKTGVFCRGIQRLCLLEPYSTPRSSEQPVSGRHGPATPI